MKRTLNLRRLAILCYALLVAWTGTANGSSSGDKKSVEFLSDGGFELGVIDVEVLRFPRYATFLGEKLPKPARVKNCALVGKAGLALPKLRKGRYRLDSATFPLLPDRRYTLSLMIRGIKKQSKVRLEVFSGKWKVVYRREMKGKTGVNTYKANFTSSAAPVSSKSGGVPHFFRIWTDASEDLCVDAISLQGPVASLSIPHERHLWIEPDNPLSIYPIGDRTGSAAIRMRHCNNCILKYEIIDGLNASILANGVLSKKAALNTNVTGGNIRLPTDKRGYYKIRLTLLDSDGLVVDMLEKAYVVINPFPGSSPNDKIFGLATEEYRSPLINAQVTPDELYALANAIGVKSARVFAAGSPGNVSSDGEHFDFRELNDAVETLRKYGIEPMVELGSQHIYNIPSWLLSNKKGEHVIDLLEEGGSLKNAKKKHRKRKKGRYFNLDKYETYLREIFQNLRGQVTAYEIWNEPGHKFNINAIMQITRLTRAVQKEIDPSSILVGFSSTNKQDLGKGVDAQHSPSFISAVIDKRGLEYVDVLSYHSGSAFLFYDKHPDYTNQESGYVDRLKRLLARAGKPDMPIWDTERGVSWRSTHTNRLDYTEGSKRWEYLPKNAVPPMEAARKLPMIYASAMANGIRRLFWFNLDGSGNNLRKTNFRWGMFDGLLEPTPQIAVYDAMTEMLGGAKFEKLVNRKDGVQAYYFTRADKTIILVYNWKDRTERLELGPNINGNIKVFDIMGRSLESVTPQKSNKLSVQVGTWPKYIVVVGTNTQ